MLLDIAGMFYKHVFICQLYFLPNCERNFFWMLIMLVHYRFTVLVLEMVLHIFICKMLNQSSSYRDGCRPYFEV